MAFALSDNIRSLRRSRGLTQEQLAEALGVTAGAVYKWEARLSLPELPMLVQMADFFDTSVDALIGYMIKDNRRDATLARLMDLRHAKDLRGIDEAEKAVMRYRGSIAIDGHELADIRRESLYEQISVIQQNVFVFNASIRDNVTMFSDFPEDDVQRAVDRAHLRGLVDARGMDYACGENGKALSGGEKQRIAIARSLLKRSPILMADEATASLDAETAHQVTADLLELDGVTRIVVTHALEEALLRRYDGIVALKDGRVAETGTFDELMAKKGYFYALYTVSY